MEQRPLESSIELLRNALAESRLAVEKRTKSKREVNFYPEYRGRELEFSREILGERYWAGQRAIFEGLFKHHWMAARTCHGPGKTRVAAGILTTFLCTRKDAIVVSTAPTDHQVRNLLWGEVGAQHARAAVLGNELPGEPDQKQWRLGPKWYALGLATNKPGRFQGFHGSVDVPDDPDEDIDLDKYEHDLALVSQAIGKAADGAPGGILLIFDEAGGIDQRIFDAAKGALTSPESYVLNIGNPDLDIASNHEMVKIHAIGSPYHRVRIGCEPGPPDPFEPPPDHEDIKSGKFVSFNKVPNWLLRPEWVQERKRDYGVGTPLYYSKIWGQFAGSDASSRIMPHELLVVCEDSECNADIGVHLGVDVAAEGGDENVAALLVNGEVRGMHAWSPSIQDRSPLMSVINVIAMLRKEWGRSIAEEYGHELEGDTLPWTNVHVEINGIGAGVCSRMHERGMLVDKVDMGSLPRYDWRDVTGDIKFLNRRTELHWVVRRLAQEGMFSLDRAYEDAWAQAQWTEFGHHEQSQGTTIKLTRKADIRKQYGRSPDHWDAVVLAFSRASGVLSFSTR